jgi:hypothetical protein
MSIDIEEELMQHDTDLTRRAARYIRIKRQTIEGMQAQLRRCRDIMECNDPLNARDLFRAPVLPISEEDEAIVDALVKRRQSVETSAVHSHGPESSCDADCMGKAL